MILKERAKESMTLEKLLRNRFGLSSRMITELRKEGMIFVNGKVRHTNYKLKSGDEVHVKLDFEKNTFPAEKMDIEILYEDEGMLVVNKDPYLMVHPTKGVPDGTLLNGLSYYLLERGEDYKIRFAHRLDRDTSGVLIICKNKFIHHKLSDQFVKRSPEKIYHALVEGTPPDHFRVEENMGRIEGEARRFFLPDGQESITEFKRLWTKGDVSLVECRPITGRTHQIRLHLAEKGHVILGDSLYGYMGSIKRQMLHCIEMEILHPVSGEKIRFFAALKKDMREIMEMKDE